jgi:hypothetical protein
MLFANTVLSSPPVQPLPSFFMVLKLTYVVVMDCQPLYPKDLVPSFITKLGNYYVETYKDRFFIEGNTPPFLKAFLWSELLYQFPTGLWAVRGLLKDSPKVPLVLLPFSCVIFITTGTCMVEYFFWDAPIQDKLVLSLLYGPYLALGQSSFPCHSIFWFTGRRKC